MLILARRAIHWSSIFFETYLRIAFLNFSQWMLEMDYVKLSKRPWHILNISDNLKLFVPFFLAEQREPNPIWYAKTHCQKLYQRPSSELTLLQFNAGQQQLLSPAPLASLQSSAVKCIHVWVWVWCPFADATQIQFHADSLPILAAARNKHAANLCQHETVVFNFIRKLLGVLPSVLLLASVSCQSFPCFSISRLCGVASWFTPILWITHLLLISRQSSPPALKDWFTLLSSPICYSLHGNSLAQKNLLWFISLVIPVLVPQIHHACTLYLSNSVARSCPSHSFCELLVFLCQPSVRSYIWLICAHVRVTILCLLNLYFSVM